METALILGVLLVAALYVNGKASAAKAASTISPPPGQTPNLGAGAGSFLQGLFGGFGQSTQGNAGPGAGSPIGTQGNPGSTAPTYSQGDIPSPTGITPGVMGPPAPDGSSSGDGSLGSDSSTWGF